MLAAGGGVGTLIGALLATALWMAAWVSGARTSLILFGAAVFGLASMWAIGHRLPRRALAVAALAAILLGTAVVAGLASRPAPGTPVARLVAALPSTSPGAVLYELLWRRDGYGLAAAAAIKDHPLLGVGVGRFTPLSTAYHQRLTGRAIPPDNAQNLWRHTLAEQGLLGFLPLLWLTMLSLRAVLAGAAAGDDLVLRVMVAALGLALLVGYPVQDAAIAVTVGTLAAALGCARADAMRNL
jgi:O-antigen ligase